MTVVSLLASAVIAASSPWELSLGWSAAAEQSNSDQPFALRTGRWLQAEIPLDPLVAHFTTDLHLEWVSPLGLVDPRTTPGYTLGAASRWGVHSERGRFTIGGWVRFAPSSEAVWSFVPSAKFRFSRSGQLRFETGFFALDPFVPAHLAATWKGVTVGAVLPLGALAAFELRIFPKLLVRLDAYVFAVGEARRARIAISGVTGPAEED